MGSLVVTPLLGPCCPSPLELPRMAACLLLPLAGVLAGAVCSASDPELFVSGQLLLVLLERREDSVCWLKAGTSPFSASPVSWGGSVSHWGL